MQFSCGFRTALRLAGVADEHDGLVVVLFDLVVDHRLHHAVDHGLRRTAELARILEHLRKPGDSELLLLLVQSLRQAVRIHDHRSSRFDRQADRVEIRKFVRQDPERRAGRRKRPDMVVNVAHQVRMPGPAELQQRVPLIQQTAAERDEPVRIGVAEELVVDLPQELPERREASGRRDSAHSCASWPSACRPESPCRTHRR